jgi:hypothetical protein
METSMSSASEFRPTGAPKLDADPAAKPDVNPVPEQAPQQGAARRSFTRQIDCSGRDAVRGAPATSGRRPPRGGGPVKPHRGHAA